ncbi:MAG: transcriptional regulator [Sulfolobaceae archaeon]
MELAVPCEVAARDLLPAIRSLIAERLIREKNLSIYKASTIMNLTPAALSNYLKGRRGSTMKNILIKDERFMNKLDEAVDSLLTGKGNIVIILCSLCTEGRRVLNKYGYNIGSCAYELTQSSFF